MNDSANFNPFKPQKSVSDIKTDERDRAARAIIDKEKVQREKKTDRLREARLAKEQDDIVNAATPAAKKKGSRSKAK